MPVPKTRQQRHSITALTHVTSVKENNHKIQRAYIDLCHKLPFLIRNYGLAQTTAWVEHNASPETPTFLSQAYVEIRQHMTEVLGYAPGDLLTGVQSASALEYMQKTMELLNALVCYRQFARLMLGVDAMVELTDMEGGEAL